MTKPNCILQLEHILGLELQDLAQIPAQRAIIDWQAMINAYAAEQENEVDAFWWPTALQRMQMSVCKNTFLQDEQGRVVGLNLYEGGLLDFSFENLEEWRHLRVLALAANNIAFLQIPKELEHLECLDLSDNPSLDTIDLKGDFPNLTTLEFSDSGLKKLRLPAGLKHLKKLDCSRCQLHELVFDGDCPALDWLDLSQNKLKQLIFPPGFQSLTHLYLAQNPDLKKLEIASTLTNLVVLNVNECDLEELPMGTILSLQLTRLCAAGNHPKNIPHIFLNTDNSTSCLEKARLWFAEIQSSPRNERNNQVKLMLLGNGSAGKSTLLCAFQNGKCSCQPVHRSTHGVEMKTLNKQGVGFNAWDFGGQEIYHSTHRLFMESPAVQLILFDPQVEQQYARNRQLRPDRETGELVPDQPIQYWYETARDLSPKSQFLLVQNKMDEVTQEDDLARQYAREHNAEFVQTSAREGTKVNYIEFIMADLAKKLPDYNMLMPASWLAVRDFFVQNLSEQTPLRTVNKAFYDGLCTEKKVHLDTRDLLLDYLHHSGFVYTHPFLKDEIIVDQNWALQAIYKLLDRKNKARLDEFRRSGGQVYVSRIFSLWGKAYKPDQKRLFLSFMESCGICFKLNTPHTEAQIEEPDIYVFTEFLPSQIDPIAEQDWQERTREVCQFRLRRTWFNRYVIAAIIAALGRKTKLYNIWRNGIQVATEAGWFKVELLELPELQQIALQISIEQRAVSTWLKPILEKLGLQQDNTWEYALTSDHSFRTLNLDQLDKEAWFGQAPTSLASKVGSPADLDDDIKDVKHEPRLRTLMFLASNPRNTITVYADSEFSFLYEKLDKANEEKGLALYLRKHSKSTFIEFIDQVKKWKPDIVHFVGHGHSELTETGEVKSQIIFHSDDNRDDDEVESFQLKEAFQTFLDKPYSCPIKLVFLNACLSAAQAKAISETGLTVIGYDRKINSELARRFATQFYLAYRKDEDVFAAAKYGLEYAAEAKSFLKIYQNGIEKKFEQHG